MASTGITTGTASTTVSFGNGLSFQITTANDAAVVGNEDATKKWVNARIGIAGADVNSIEEDHTFTVTLEKDAGAAAGFVAAGGEQVDVTLVDANGAVHVLDTANTTCDVPAETHDGAGTDVNGQCVGDTRPPGPWWPLRKPARSISHAAGNLTSPLDSSISCQPRA